MVIDHEISNTFLLTQLKLIAVSMRLVIKRRIKVLIYVHACFLNEIIFSWWLNRSHKIVSNKSQTHI
jgi:hypothetical protein